jgi:ABC-type oligopeptide transport system ATPase subunit
LLDVRALVKRYEHKSWRRGTRATDAVASVSFTVQAGEMFGLVGESGSGKTTTARCLLRLVEPTSGEVRFRGEDVLRYDRDRLRAWRREVQMVFQDPYGSLDPRMRVDTSLREPLDIHHVGDRESRAARVAELLAMVGLEPGAGHRYPNAFSGGQRQRIALARALALSPSLLVADEPVSALDASMQAQIVNLLLDLRGRLGLACLFISHDLRLVQCICDRVAVMYRGRIVEMAPVARLFTHAVHPYTRALLAAVPLPDPDAPPPRVEFDPASCEPPGPLVQIAEGHWAEGGGGGGDA